MQRKRRLLTAAAALGAGSAILLRGGFFEGDRAVFAVLAGAALVVAIAVDDRGVARALRSPPVAVLVALGLWTAVSAIWAVAEPRPALVAGLAIVAAGALAAVAAVLAGLPGGVARIAFVVAGLAEVAALAGLYGVATRGGPWAQSIDGAWRAGGPFEYPPALALLQVSALPALLRWTATAARLPALLSGAGALLAIATVALAGSRLYMLLTALLLLAVVIWPRATIGRGRVPSGVPIVAGAVLVAAVATAVATGIASDGLDGFAHGRLDLWGAGLAAIDRPVWGSGAESFATVSSAHQEGAVIRYAHNLALEALVELGILGVALVAGLYLAALRLLLSTRDASALWLLGPAMIAFLLSNAVDWTWHLSGCAAVFALALGGLVGDLDNRRKVPVRHMMSFSRP